MEAIWIPVSTQARLLRAGRLKRQYMAARFSDQDGNWICVVGEMPAKVDYSEKWEPQSCFLQYWSQSNAMCFLRFKVVPNLKSFKGVKVYCQI